MAQHAALLLVGRAVAALVQDCLPVRDTMVGVGVRLHVTGILLVLGQVVLVRPADAAALMLDHDPLASPFQDLDLAALLHGEDHVIMRAGAVAQVQTGIARSMHIVGVVNRFRLGQRLGVFRHEAAMRPADGTMLGANLVPLSGGGNGVDRAAMLHLGDDVIACGRPGAQVQIAVLGRVHIKLRGRGSAGKQHGGDECNYT